MELRRRQRSRRRRFEGGPERSWEGPLKPSAPALDMAGPKVVAGWGVSRPAAKDVGQFSHAARVGGVLIVPGPRMAESTSELQRAARAKVAMEDHEQVEGYPNLRQRGGRRGAPWVIRLIAPVPPWRGPSVTPCKHGPIQERLLKVGVNPAPVVKICTVPVGTVNKSHQRRALR